jgi:serine/threonine protein kinase
MVFCQSDLFPKNFMIDTHGGMVLIDFDIVSILPSSFARYSLSDNRLGFDIRERVWVPSTEGVDNTQALSAVEGRMAQGSAFLAILGERLPGGEEETQDRIANIT